MKHPIVAPALLAAALLTGAVAQPPAPRSSCEVCHSRAAADHAVSRHASAGLTCVTCHGGRADDFTTAAMARANGFKGKPARADQPAFCAGCHAKQEQMRPYGLPTDQYELYQGSRHGQAMARGATTAVCSDCHTTHAVRAVSDPLSTVAHANVPATCARCHDNPQVMKASGLPTGQYRAFAASVHGQVLTHEGRQAGPDCATCHGSHGGAPPAVSTVQLVCARCHAASAAAFAAGEHRAPADHGRMAPCVSCHGAHAIAPARDELLQSACARCHAAGSSGLKVAEDVRQQLGRAREQYAAVERAVAAAYGTGLPVTRLQGELNECRTALYKAAVAQHSARSRDVERCVTVVHATADDLHHAQEQLTDTKRVRLGLLLYALGFLAVSIYGLWLERRRALAAWRGGRP